MFKIFKKFIPNNPKFLIRLDDIAENMNWEMMDQTVRLFDAFGIKPVLGVIPNNQDPELLSYPKKNINFWDEVKNWEKRGWEVGMHGNNHVYDKTCNKNDYLGHGGNTEFCGHAFEKQLEKIKQGLNKFKKEKIEIRTFFAPNHTFDQNTLMALKECGVTNVLDGYGLTPYEEKKIKFIPQLFYRILPLPFGIQTFQIHLNYYKQDDFNNLKKFIELNSTKIITYDEAISKINNGTWHKIIRILSKKILQAKRLVKN